MELLIIKNNKDITARFVDHSEDATFSLLQVESIPEYPNTDAGFGKNWELKYENDILEWKSVDRELTIEEKLERLEDAINGLNVLGVN